MIGRYGLKEFCEHLNRQRAAQGMRERYFLVLVDGKLTLQDEAQGK